MLRLNGTQDPLFADSFQRGEEAAFDCLYREYFPSLTYFANRILADTDTAEDVVQDSFLQTFRSISGFDSTRLFEPWFMRSVVDASVKMMQRSAKQVEVGDEADESLFAELAARVESVEEQVESIEVQNQIWDAMQKLSPRQRAVIVQRYFLEMSEKEMAEEAGSAVGTVKWMPLL